MIKLNNLQQPPEVYDAVTAVIQSGRYVKGPIAEEFEKAWAERCNMRFGIAVGSGAQALEIAIQSLLPPINRGNYLSTQSYAFKAVSNAIRRVGYNFYANDINPIIYTHHLHDALPQEKPLLEDCSHCHGYRPIADTAIFSLFPAKIFGAIGEAGIIVTNSEDVRDTAKKLRNHEQPMGTNARMDEIQAAALMAKLPYLDRWVARRKEIVDKYDVALGRKTPGEFHYAYCIPGSREKARKLIEAEIETSFYYDENYMALPLHPFLTDEEVERIINVAKTL